MNRIILLVNCRYERFVIALEEASRDMLPILKDKALKVCDPDMPCTSQYLIYMHKHPLLFYLQGFIFILPPSFV